MTGAPSREIIDIPREPREPTRAAEAPREPVPPMIAPGTLIDGCYRVIGAIGEGGMGIVLRAFDEQLRRDVAIKFIRPEHLADDAAREAFVREARAMARTRHPNLVEIYAYGEFGTSPYFVMEYVDGCDLDAWVARHEGARVSMDEALAVLDQLCQGVAALHAAGSSHRDLKPNNILIGPGFRVVVTDMGLARAVDVEIHEEGVAGTPAYMAPETAARKAVASERMFAADVYALGVIAFELLTGQLPFDSSSTMGFLHAHIYDPPPLPSSRHPELGRAFDGALLRALEKDPEQRTPSVDALRAELAAARDSLTAPGSELRVLIADDDASCRHWTSQFVQAAFPNASIATVPDGDAALRHARSRPPHVALIDLNMPGLNGIELTAAMRGDPRTAAVPIVVITGVGGATDWRLLQSLGASGFVVKPIDPEALCAIIRRVVAAPASATRG